MNKVIRAEFGRTINAGLIIAIAGIIFSICFDSFNDLIAGLRNGQGYVGYFFSNAAFGGMCTHYMLPVFTALPFSVMWNCIVVFNACNKISYCRR